MHGVHGFRGANTHVHQQTRCVWRQKGFTSSRRNHLGRAARVFGEAQVKGNGSWQARRQWNSTHRSVQQIISPITCLTHQRPLCQIKRRVNHHTSIHLASFLLFFSSASSPLLSFSPKPVFYLPTPLSLTPHVSASPLLFTRSKMGRGGGHVMRQGCGFQWCDSREDLGLLKPCSPWTMWSWFKRCQTWQRYVIRRGWIMAWAHLWSERQVIPLSSRSHFIFPLALQRVLTRTAGAKNPSELCRGLGEMYMNHLPVNRTKKKHTLIMGIVSIEINAYLVKVHNFISSLAKFLSKPKYIVSRVEGVRCFSSLSRYLLCKKFRNAY